MTARLIVYDNQARRTSALTADKLLTLKAREAPLPYTLIAGATFGGVVVVLLLVSIFRGGSGGRRRAANLPASRVVPGAGPYAAPVAPAAPLGGDFAAAGYGGIPASPASRAVIAGAAGTYTIMPGLEVRAGRDSSTCQILLTEPRVSGTHSSLKFEAGQFSVRDENSNNGTFVNGQRIPPATWTSVSAGALLRFGPVEFTVRFE